MKSKYLILIAFSLLSINLVQGQKKHEVKLSLTGLFNNEFIPKYEMVLSEKIGIEFGLGWDYSKLRLSNFDLTNLTNFEQFEFSATQLNPSIGGKYYFMFNKKYGSGLFVGPYIRLNYLLNREEGYVEKWEELNNRQATERILTDHGAKNLYYVLNGGFKWIIKSNFIAEIMITWTIEELIGKGASEFDDFSSFRGDSFIKIGYRF